MANGRDHGRNHRRDHGGDLDRAQTLFGQGDWIDLSTGINAIPYRVEDIPASVWATLPTRSDISALEEAARHAYGAGECGVALAGAQAAIQLVPRLLSPGDARVVAPTYNEHAGALEAQGWQVQNVADIDALAGARLAVLVNPNNPDGRAWGGDAVLRAARGVDLLVVDESFADATPDISILPHALPGNVIVLRSFGKFFGLAGLRLGFAFGARDKVDALRALAGPWAVSGPAIALGRRALADTAWHEATRVRLIADAARLDALAEAGGWSLVGGTPLFRTYETGDAAAAQERLASAQIWTRRFPYSDGWLRLGLPGSEAQWERLRRAL